MEDLKDVLQEDLRYYLEQEKIIIARLSILPKGRIKEKKINSDNYYYLQYRKGGKVIDQYIGKTVPRELSADLDLRKKLEGELKQIRKAIKMLHAKNNPQTDFIEPIKEILSQFTRLGLWESGIEIIGSWCFLIYQKYLPLQQYPLKTQDIDILIPLPYSGKAFDFSVFFRQLGFSEHFNPDGSIYFAAASLKVELLAPHTGRGEKSSRYIKDLAISPQLLRFVEQLLKESRTLQISRGIKVKLPAPSSFFLHKLLISTHVKRKNKKEKDIRQAVYTGKYVVTDKGEKEKLLAQWQDFSKPWKRRVKKGLEQALSLVPLETAFIEQFQQILA
jgi:hypothetical protein